MNHSPVHFQVSFDSKVADERSVHAAIAHILKQVGCPNCGRLSVLDLHLVGDPGPELGKAGITGITQLPGIAQLGR
jgi:hypothetical protein